MVFLRKEGEIVQYSLKKHSDSITIVLYNCRLLAKQKNLHHANDEGFFITSPQQVRE